MEVSQERNIDIDGDYTEALARVASNKNGIGVFGLSFYMNNTSTLDVAKIGGVVPSQETIATGEYPISRPLYFYIKDAHLGTIPGLLEYAQFFMSNDMATEGSALVNYGLVEDPELATTQEMLNNK
jgi:phosphate transport system substrate-binding protein